MDQNLNLFHQIIIILRNKLKFNYNTMENKLDYLEDYKINSNEIYEIYLILYVMGENFLKHPHLFTDNKTIGLLDCAPIFSSENTIKSIDFCCKRGYFSDAFTLVRKYRDDMIQFIFHTKIIIDSMQFTKIKSNEYYCKSKINKIIVPWIKNSNKKNMRTTDYIQELKKHDYLIKRLMEQYLKSTWNQTNKTLNTYVHSNNFQNIINNYFFANYINKDYAKNKAELIQTIRNITSIIVSIFMILDPMVFLLYEDRDYIKYGYDFSKEVNNNFSPIVTEYINKYFDGINKGLIKFLEKNNTFKYTIRYSHEK